MLVADEAARGERLQADHQEDDREAERQDRSELNTSVPNRRS